MVQRAVPTFLPVDDLTLPGETPFERIDGELIAVAPAEEPHGLSHTALAALLTVHVTAAYQVALDMLTRVAVDSEVAPDASVYPVEREVTGGRKLEELAFEVMGSERRTHAARKAQLLVARGVRRVFAIDLRWSQVLEWDRALGDWRLLPPGSEIDDPCFVRPLPTSALRGVGSSEAVVEGILSQDHPRLRQAMVNGAQREVERVRSEAQREVERVQREAERTQREAERTQREAIVDLCEVLGVALTDERRAHLAGLDLAGLEALRARLKRERAWPTG